MELKEFAENFDPNATIRIVQNEEILYEGKIDALAKFLDYRVISRSGKIIDGMTQIEIEVKHTIS